MFIVRRGALMAPMLLLASILMFLLITFAGDPLTEVRSRQPPPPPEVVHAMMIKLRLDQPLPLRYWQWISGVFVGDFGPSVIGLDIRAELATRIVVTLRLVSAGFILAFFLALGVAIIGATRQFSKADYMTGVISVLMLSIPMFWLAVIVKRGAITINRELGYRLFSTVGDGGTSQAMSVGAYIGAIFAVMALPTFVLTLQAFGSWSRYARISLIDALKSEYVKLARAKGVPEWRVLLFHGLRTAMAPMITVVAFSSAAIIGEAIIIETVFQWRGMADLLITALRNYDVYVVLGWLMVMGTLIMSITLIADVMYALLDPRVRYE